MSIIKLTEKDLSNIIKQVINNSNAKKFILKEDCVKSMALIDPKTGKPAYIDSKTGKYCKPKTTTTQRSVNPTEKNLTDLIVVNSKPSNKKTISPKYVKKIRLIFPAPGIETTALNFFKKELLFLGIITGFYTSLSSAISFIKTLIKKHKLSKKLFYIALLLRFFLSLLKSITFKNAVCNDKATKIDATAVAAAFFIDMKIC